MKSSFTIAAHPCVPLWSTRRPVHSKEQTVSLLQYFPSCVNMTRGIFVCSSDVDFIWFIHCCYIHNTICLQVRSEEGFIEDFALHS